MERAISDPSVVVAATDQFSCPLGDDTIILDLKAGLYFSLNSAGALVWELLQEPRTVRDLREAILEGFDVDAETCDRDLRALLGELASRSLVEIRDAAVA